MTRLCGAGRAVFLESHADFSVQSQLADAMEIVALEREGSFQHRIHLRIAEMPIDGLERLDVVGPHEVNPRLAVDAGLEHDSFARAGLSRSFGIDNLRIAEFRRPNSDLVSADHEDLAIDGLGIAAVIIDYFAGLVRLGAKVDEVAAENDKDIVRTAPETNTVDECEVVLTRPAWANFNRHRAGVRDVVLLFDCRLDVFNGGAKANLGKSGSALASSNSLHNNSPPKERRR